MAMSAPPGTIHGQTPTPSGEDNGALGSALPQRAGKVAVGQRQDIGQRNDIGGVAVVDHTVGTVGGRLADAVVHEVARELRGRAGTPRPDPQTMRQLSPLSLISTMPMLWMGSGSTLRKNLPEPVVMKYSLQGYRPERPC